LRGCPGISLNTTHPCKASTFVLADYNPAQAPKLLTPAINPATNQRSAFDPLNSQYYPVYAIGLEIPGSGNPAAGAPGGPRVLQLVVKFMF